MTRLRKINLKTFSFAFATLALVCAITWQGAARHTYNSEIYSTLTSDTTKPQKKDSAITSNSIDTIGKRDTLPSNQKTDTFSLKMAKDTLEGPVNYTAADSAVILVKEKKMLLYGKTKTTFKDITLTAPQVEINQETNILTAVNARDSTGAVANRARFEQGENQFESDTIRYNFKSQKGLTKNTFTQQSEMFVQGAAIKRYNTNTIFIQRARMTTCDLDEPHFAFVANKAKFINNKVAITGPVHPEFEGVPIPIYLPFGFFPLNQGRHSGFLPPTFTATENYGLGLEGLGYYKVLNDNFDATLRGNIYSYGGWNATFTPDYYVRYRYRGSLNLSLQHTKVNFKGDPDYSLVKTFSVNWNHSVDPRARPGTTFTGNVNVASTKYNQYLINSLNPNINFTNQLSSSVAYSKTWIGKPFNLTLSANHNQNNNLHLINVSLPTAGFTVTTIYPFQRKEVVGAQKWYEKLGIGYSGSFQNQASFYDTTQVRLRNILDTMQWGAQHSIPISLSLPPLGPFIISPSVSYSEVWLQSKYLRHYNIAKEKVDTTIQKGFFTDRQVSFGAGLNTAIYGTYQFKNSRLIALRHVIRPTIGFSYHPDLSSKHFYNLQVDSTGRTMRVSEFTGGTFSSGYSEGASGSINFGLDNNLEMKYRSKKDTGANAIKKIRLLDGFGFNGSYDLLRDSMKLSNLDFYLRSTLFEKINISASALLNPYQSDRFGTSINQFAWQGGKFSLGQITTGSVSVSTNFQSKKNTDGTKTDKPENAAQVNEITDPSLLADKQRLMDYMRRNPAEFVDFSIQWQVSLSFSMNFSKTLKPDYSGYQTIFNSSLYFNPSFNLTPKWNFSTNGFYDFRTMKLQTFTMAISRDMHCWQMSIGVTPVGAYRSFNISISPKSSILRDLKVNRTRYFRDY